MAEYFHPNGGVEALVGFASCVGVVVGVGLIEQDYTDLHNNAAGHIQNLRLEVRQIQGYERDAQHAARGVKPGALQFLSTEAAHRETLIAQAVAKEPKVPNDAAYVGEGIGIGLAVGVTSAALVRGASYLVFKLRQAQSRNKTPQVT